MSATNAASGATPQALAGQIKKLLVLASVILLAACATAPRGGKGPPPVVSEGPLDGMHRVALLLPVSVSLPPLPMSVSLLAPETLSYGMQSSGEPVMFASSEVASALNGSPFAQV